MRRRSRVASSLLLLLIAAACGSRGEAPLPSLIHPALDSAPHDAPVIVLESNANFLWNETPSKRFPRFVLYGDGHVISLSTDSPAYTYVTASLTREEASTLLQSTTFSQLFDFAGAHYVASKGTDVGLLILSLRREDGTYARIEVRGWSDEFPSQPGPDFPPLAVYQAVQFMDRFRAPSAQQWTPYEYELYSWPCGYGDENATSWPQEWPRLPEREPVSGSRWNVTRLVGVDAGKVSSTLGPSISTIARYVHSGGKKWCLTYRPVLPGEAHWLTGGLTAASGAN